MPFRDLDGKSHKPLPLGVENDRVFSDLWGKGSMPVVLNNPYSEKEQVSGGVSLVPTLHSSLNVLGKTTAKPPWGENQLLWLRNGVRAQPAALTLDCGFGL